MLINITTATTTVLNTIGNGNGNVRIRIANNGSAAVTISLLLRDGIPTTNATHTDYYVIKNLVIPVATTALFEDIDYNPDDYSLCVVTTGTTNITIGVLH